METAIAVAANGHLMEYEVKPNGEYVEWSARCVKECRACRDGEYLPDW